MTTAVVVGMQSEANIVQTMPDTVVIIGAGDAVTLAADLGAAIDAGADHVLSFGLCGALSPKLAAGALVVGGMAVEYLAAAVFCDAAWGQRIAAATGSQLVNVTLSQATVSTASAKAILHSTTGADVVDMESCVAASVAQARGVPFAMLRAVSDAADQDIPPAALAVLASGGGLAALWALIDSLVIEDDQLSSLILLADTSALAYNALAQALADVGVNYSEN